MNSEVSIKDVSVRVVQIKIENGLRKIGCSVGTHRGGSPLEPSHPILGVM